MRLTVGDIELLLRDPGPDDEGYIFSSAIRTVRLAREFVRMDGTEFCLTVGMWIREAFAVDPIGLVACFPEDPGFIVAFVFGDPRVPRLSYLHVRSSFCGLGVAEAIVDETLGIRRDVTAVHSFPTPALDRLHRSGRWPELVYRPWTGAEAPPDPAASRRVWTR